MIAPSPTQAYRVRRTGKPPPPSSIMTAAASHPSHASGPGPTSGAGRPIQVVTVSYNATVSRRLGSSAAGQDCQWCAAPPRPRHCLFATAVTVRLRCPPRRRPLQSSPQRDPSKARSQSVAAPARSGAAWRVAPGRGRRPGSEAAAFAAAAASFVSLSPPGQVASARLAAAPWPARRRPGGPAGIMRGRLRFRRQRVAAGRGSGCSGAAGDWRIWRAGRRKELNGSLGRPLESAMAQ